jgi:flagellar M-ring protein FliF
MAAVTLALVGFFAFLILRVTAPQMTPLFTDLSYDDSSAIVKELERQGIAYELRNDGGIVMVPKDRVARLRMSLAGEGLPKGGGVGYEIFDKSDALGTTSFIQNINNLRALEGELSRTIRGLESSGARASGAAGAAAVFARQGGAVGVGCAQGAWRARAAAGTGHSSFGRVRGQRTEATARVDRR